MRTLDARSKNYPKHIQEIAQNQLDEIIKLGGGRYTAYTWNRERG